MAEKYQHGVLLATVGAPSLFEKKEVGSFYKRYFSNSRIQSGTKIAWRVKLYSRILRVRTDSYMEKIDYLQSRDEKQPTTNYNKLALALERELKDEVIVNYGECYGQQSVQNALEKLKLFGCRNLFVLPLYPQSAYITSGVVRDIVNHSLKKIKWNIDYHFIDNYHDNPFYIKALASSLKHTGFEVDSDDRLLFSYQSISVKDIEAGDTFELQTGATSLQIASELEIDRNRWTIGYQNPLDTQGEWLKPASDEVVVRWAEGGTGRIFFMCPGYAMENIETLYDVKHQFKSIYTETRKMHGKSYGQGEYIYSPCLDLTKAHVKVLTNVLQPYIKETN